MNVTIKTDFLSRILLSGALLVVALVTLASPRWGSQIKGYGYQFTIGGTVSGLSGAGLVLQINGGDDLAVSANGPFTFASALNDGSTYSVTTQTQPISLSQTCNVINGNGTLSNANVSSVVVVCTTNTFTIGGTVNGLLGSGLVLQKNGGDDLAIAADGPFTFASALFDGSTYGATLQTQPTNPHQTCSLANGSGTLAGAHITDVLLQCVTDMADLSVTITDGQQILAAGDPITYIITVSNNGPLDVVGARVENDIPAQLSSATWDCLPGVGASCSAGGIGDIDDLANIPSGSTVTYILTAATAADFSGDIINTVTVTPPIHITDPTVDNNIAEDHSATDAMFMDGFEDPLMVLKRWLEDILTGQ